MWQNLHFYLYELTENLNQYACSWKYDKKKKKKKEKKEEEEENRKKIVIAYWKNSTIQIDFFFFFFFLLISKNIDLLNDNEMNKTS